MKRKFTILTAALALLAFLAIPMGMRGQTRSEVTYTFSQHYNANTVLTDVEIAFDNSITGTFGKGDGSTAPQYYTNGTAVRWYGGNTLNITASNATISEIVLTYTQKNKSVSTDVGTYNHDNGTWSGSASSVTFTVENGSGHNRVSVIKVTYTVSGGTLTCATPTFSPAGGTYTSAQTVTISCSTEGATIYYTTDGNDPTTSSTVYSAPINVSSEMTIKAMATATDYDNSAVATAEYAFITLEHAGTLEDPYNVADARAAIDANAGTQGVYATGIVSEIVTEWSTQYNNITFNMVDEEGDEVFLQAYRCASGTGVDASQVAVGDVAVVYGNLTKYGSTYEFAQGCELVSLTHPETTEPSITVIPATVNFAATGAEGFQMDNLTIAYENIEVTNYESFTVQFYDNQGNETTESTWLVAGVTGSNAEGYVVQCVVGDNDGEARTAFFKVYAYDANNNKVYSNLVTITQAEYVAPTYAELPFSFNGGKADIEGTDGLYQEGLGGDYSSAPKLKFDGTGDWLLLQFNERPGTLTFDIKGNSFSGGTFKVQTSADGVSYSDLETYTTFGNNETFEEVFNNLDENVRYIKWIYTTKASGNVGLGNIALAEYAEEVHTITVSPELIEVGAEGGEGGLEYIVNWDNGDWAEGFQFYDAEGETVDQPDWITIVYQIGENEDYHYTIAPNTGDARTAYFKAYTDDEGTMIYSNLVTVNQAAAVTPVTGDKYVKVTSTDDLTSGQYLIVYEEGSVAFDGSLETLDAVSNTIGVTIQNDEISMTAETAAAEFTIDMTAGTIKSASGYYIGQTSDANGMQASAEIAYTNTISIVNEGDANIVSSGGAYLRFNSASNQNRFRYYKSSSYTGQKAIQLYKKVEPATETYTLTIDGYTEGNRGGYHLIASPVTVDPSTNGMTEGNFDLYYFNQAEQDEWRNWKEEDGGHFNLVPGTGYLYAKQATTDNEVFQFSLTGTPYEGDGTVVLTKLEGVDWSGLNLVGNPFNEIAYIDREFYTMNGDGNAIIPATNNSIQAMEGIFVYAETDGEEMQFSTEVPAESGEKIIMNVTRNRGNVIDRAIVSFGQGGMLPKFQLNPNSTKLYMTEGNQEFAVVRSANEGELPVSFKASENGNYTLNIETENVEVSYLHLIDNKTGADTDLLATPSYTFEANTTDYANRFKLVFTTGSSTGSVTFAYFNGNEWVINNEGEATLQVVDVTGRVLSSEQINGSFNNSLNLSAGVYVLRLSNGNTVKTQKIVID